MTELVLVKALLCIPMISLSSRVFHASRNTKFFDMNRCLSLENKLFLKVLHPAAVFVVLSSLLVTQSP